MGHQNNVSSQIISSCIDGKLDYHVIYPIFKEIPRFNKPILWVGHQNLSSSYTLKVFEALMNHHHRIMIINLIKKILRDDTKDVLEMILRFSTNLFFFFFISVPTGRHLL